MSKAQLEDRIQQWLEAHHEIVQNPPLGANRCSIEFENARQRGIFDELSKIGSKDLSRQTKEQCALNVVRVRDNIASLDYIGKIAGLEDLFSGATTEILDSAHQLSNVEMESLAEVRKPLLGTVQRCWQWAEQLATLTRLHMRNAAEYNAFHIECHDENERLSRNYSPALKQLECLFHLTPAERTKRLLTTLSDSLKHCLGDWEAVDRLLVTSHSVVPVGERLGKQRSPSLRAVCACKYETPEFRIAEGEELTVLDNTDRQIWRVALADGSEARVPSIIVWIPPCDLLSVDKATGLRKKFSDQWTSLAERFKATTVSHLNSVFEAFLDRQALIEVTHLDTAQELFDLIQTTILADDPTEPVQKLARLLAEVKARTVHKDQLNAYGARLRPDCVHFPTTELVRLHTIISKLWQHLKDWTQFQEGILMHTGLGCMHHDGSHVGKLSSRTARDIERKLAQTREELQRLQGNLDAWSEPNRCHFSERHPPPAATLIGHLDLGGDAAASPAEAAAIGLDATTDTGSLAELLMQLLQERREFAVAALRRSYRAQETQTMVAEPPATPPEPGETAQQRRRQMTASAGQSQARGTDTGGFAQVVERAVVCRLEPERLEAAVSVSSGSAHVYVQTEELTEFQDETEIRMSRPAAAMAAQASESPSCASVYVQTNRPIVELSKNAENDGGEHFTRIF